MRFWQKFSFKILFLLLPSCLLASCFSSPKLPSVNANFEKKYGKEVAQMQAGRVSDAPSEKVTVLQAPSADEVTANLAASGEYYPYVDVNKFNEKVPQIYLPNGESYEQTKMTGPANSVPPDIFEISYNLGLYPAFHRAGTEFDSIPIPPQDAYGVKTEMAEKSYLLAGNNSLQRGIDKINSEKSSDDIDNSAIVIREQKQLRREQRMLKTFGESAMEMASLAEEKPEKVSEKKKE